MRETRFIPWPPQRVTPSLPGFTLIELLIVVGIIAVLSAILFPVFQGVRKKANLTSCVSNQHQIAIDIHVYAQDHGGVLPTTDQVWSGSTIPPAVTNCPSANASGNSYGYNGHLSGVPLAKLKYPTDTLLISHCTPEANNILLTSDDIPVPGPHDRMITLTMLDGSTSVKPDTQVLANPLYYPGMQVQSLTELKQVYGLNVVAQSDPTLMPAINAAPYGTIPRQQVDYPTGCSGDTPPDAQVQSYLPTLFSSICAYPPDAYRPSPGAAMPVDTILLAEHLCGPQTLAGHHGPGVEPLPDVNNMRWVNIAGGQSLSGPGVPEGVYDFVSWVIAPSFAGIDDVQWVHLNDPSIPWLTYTAGADPVHPFGYGPPKCYDSDTTDHSLGFLDHIAKCTPERDQEEMENYLFADPEGLALRCGSDQFLDAKRRFLLDYAHRRNPQFDDAYWQFLAQKRRDHQRGVSNAVKL